MGNILNLKLPFHNQFLTYEEAEEFLKKFLNSVITKELDNKILEHYKTIENSDTNFEIFNDNVRAAFAKVNDHISEIIDGTCSDDILQLKREIDFIYSPDLYLVLAMTDLHYWYFFLLQSVCKKVDDIANLVNLKDYFRKFYTEKLNAVIDISNYKVMHRITGREISPEQADRYRVKYERALKAKADNNMEIFKTEAELSGKSVEELVDDIIAIGEQWKEDVDESKVLLDGARVLIAKKIKEAETKDNFSQIDTVIKKLKYLPNKITNSYIETLI